MKIVEDYPKALIKDILDYEIENFTPDHMRGLSVALSSLPKRSQDIILLKYRFGMKTKEIAEFYNVTTKTIYFILKKSMRQIRRYPCRDVIIHGLKTYINKYLESLTEDHKNEIKEDRLNTSFEQLNLSVRSFNCLARYLGPLVGGRNITVRVIADMNIDQIYSVRNLGIRSIENIVHCLKEFSVTDTAWYQVLDEINKK